MELALKLFDFATALTYEQIMTYQESLVAAARQASGLVRDALGPSRAG
ncbi:hypothetical protein [Nocardioides humi]|nr:hypothetical protein [Nocardioides humi]